MAKKAKHKKNKPRKQITKRKKCRAGGDEDTRQRRKYARGGRIEAYTFGEVLSSKNWP